MMLGLEVLTVNDSSTPSSALRTWVVQVGISSRGSLVKCKVVQGFLPGFSKAEKFVSDTFVENETYY